MKWAIVVLCLAFTMRTSGQTTSTYNTGIGHATPLIPTTQAELPKALSPVSVDWRYAEGMLTLHLMNNSSKDITAYNISISRKYADGTADTPGSSEMMEEMLGALIFQQQIVRPDGGVFAAGTSRYEHRPETRDIVDVTAFVDMAIFADATAYVQNERAFKELMAIRKGQLMAMVKVDGVIKHALADPSVSSPVSAVVAELTPLLVNLMSKQRSMEKPEDQQEMELQSDLANLRSMQQRKDEREFLTRYAEDLEKRIELMKPHCEVVAAK